MTKKEKGKVKWYKEAKGFGFIEVDSGPDIFVHASQVTEKLSEGDPVEFETKENKKGPVAVNVKKIAG